VKSSLAAMATMSTLFTGNKSFALGGRSTKGFLMSLNKVKIPKIEQEFRGCFNGQINTWERLRSFLD